MKWYFVEDGQKNGPHEEGAFEELIRSGMVGPQTLVWRTGMENWQTLEEVRPPQVPPPVEAAESAADAATAYDLPVHGGAGGEERSCAGFWIRCAAKLIDGLVVGVFSILFTALFGVVMFGLTAGNGGSHAGTFLAAQGLSFIVQTACQAAYVTFFLSRYAATPGKMATGLIVVRSDGSALTAGRALGRYFGEWLSYITCGIGYLMVAFDEEKRALHDRVCDTRVVFKTPRSPAGTLG